MELLKINRIRADLEETLPLTNKTYKKDPQFKSKPIGVF